MKLFISGLFKRIFTCSKCMRRKTRRRSKTRNKKIKGG